MDDVLILGGGVIGLSLAYELARGGARVRVVDRGLPGQEASWAGAGILPPAIQRPNDHPYQQLTGLSHTLHRQWSEQLREETGVDNGYRRSGGLYVARTREETEALREVANDFRDRGIEVEEVSPGSLGDMEPALAAAAPAIATALLLPDECQLRNPRHLKALLLACASRGVTVEAGVEVEQCHLRGGRIDSLAANGGVLRAKRYCVAAGAWTRILLARLGLALAIKPIRGQIVLLAAPRPVLQRIVNEGSRYLVPRPDGRLLIGSTEEDAGFEKRNTAAAVGGLIEFAASLAPVLASASVERVWSGLRPATRDGLPYLGSVPGIDNLFVAAGHFRGGLHLSTGTAVVMACLLRDEAPPIDLAPFRLDRD